MDTGRTRLAKYAKQCGNKELDPKTREKISLTAIYFLKAL